MQRRRLSFNLVVSLVLVSLVLGCGGQETPPSAAATPASSALRKIDTVTTPAAAAATTQPQGAAKPATKVEPKGELVYAWHTTITPAWLDPQEAPPQVTPYNFAYALHDALVKHMPGKTFAPSLAESYEIAPDFKSATFKLRPNIKFHNGEPLTTEDVKYTYEKYRGANAKVLKDKTERIETPDARTVRFVFKEAFLDFLVLYGSPASGAGWIVPKKYYEEVGPNGFKQKPIGAGPYKFVSQKAGTELVLEAFTDYWRKTPALKTLIMRGVPEAATRVAQLQTGEVEVINQVPGELLDVIKKDSKLQLVPLRAAPYWLEFPGYDKADNPFHDKRVRQAVSLAIDRQAISDAEMGGNGTLEGNWIPQDWPGAIERPAPEFNVAKAKQLMAEAGFANGFDVPQITPLPPYFSTTERITGQLRQLNIRTKVNTMERGAYYEALANGPNRLKGLIMQVSGAPGDAASRIRENALCSGSFSGTCIPEVEEKMKRYESSNSPDERKKLLDEIQAYLLDNYVMVPVIRQAFTNARGPKMANKTEDIMGSIPQYTYLGPYEDIELK
ncbi:MAG: ABC transporter substrate-binding protein [Chloroflexi bacterium]|nr:ABC transporter substrate-binding protein [Chloroflexota bacterium]